MADDLLSISEVGRITGLQSSALRYYERAGLIKPAARVSGRRHYSGSVVQRLAVVALLQDAGFSIGEIATVVRGGRRANWRPVAEKKLEELDQHLERVKAAQELLTAALDCGCSSLESCDLVERRRTRHRKATQTLMPRFGPG